MTGNASTNRLSVGKLINLYRDGDLEIHPDFQHYFRWSPQQKSRWIESIVLGIPTLPLFLFQHRV